MCWVGVGSPPTEQWVRKRPGGKHNTHTSQGNRSTFRQVALLEHHKTSTACSLAQLLDSICVSFRGHHSMRGSNPTCFFMVFFMFTNWDAGFGRRWGVVGACSVRNVFGNGSVSGSRWKCVCGLRGVFVVVGAAGIAVRGGDPTPTYFPVHSPRSEGSSVCVCVCVCVCV